MQSQVVLSCNRNVQIPETYNMSCYGVLIEVSSEMEKDKSWDELVKWQHVTTNSYTSKMETEESEWELKRIPWTIFTDFEDGQGLWDKDCSLPQIAKRKKKRQEDRFFPRDSRKEHSLTDTCILAHWYSSTSSDLQNARQSMMVF